MKTKATKPYHFSIRVSTDTETGEILSVYFQVRKGIASEVLERANGAAFVNYDKSGNLLGIELLEPCSLSVLNSIANKEPAAARSHVRRFFRNSAPRQMIHS
jgi:uncharacterized protein YuzE